MILFLCNALVYASLIGRLS